MNNQKRILFIEDDRQFGQKFYETLSAAGYYVAWQNGTDGAKYWATHKDIRWDMIIADQRMPGELGAVFLVFLSELEKQDPDTMDRRSSLYQKIRGHFVDLSDSEFSVHLKELKAHPSIRVIYSGYAEDDSIRKGLEQGVIHRFISKKTDTEEVLNIIGDLFRK